MPEVEIAVASVAPEASWDCEYCGRRPVVAYLARKDEEITTGYCDECLTPAILAEFSGQALAS